MNNLFQTKLLRVLIGGFLLISLNSCMKDEDYEEVPIAVVTMVNGFVSSNGVLYASDNNTIQYSYAPLLYKQYDYFRIFPGSRRIRIFTDDNNQLVDETYTFKESTYYTSFVYGWQDAPQHLLSEDELLENLGDKSAFRFLHLSPSEDEVNVYLNNKETLLYTERVYEGENEDEDSENTTFVAQNSGKHTIIITDSNDETLIEREYTFEADTHYSIILIGESNSMARPLYLGIVKQYNRTSN